MKITIRGVRGSIPTTTPDSKYYGGNTSSTDVSEDGCSLVLDAGSGIRQSNIDHSILNKRVDILLTHLHLDHIQGLGFYRPLYDPSMEVHIWGPASNTQSLHERLSRFLSPPLFPLHIRELPCKIQFHEIVNDQFEIGPFKIHSAYVIHPGPTVGFRICGKNAVVTYIPDHEPALGPAGILEDERWISGYDLAYNADLLIHDAQYSSEEYKSKIGWGHSSVDDAMLLASKAKVKRLILTHHDPSHTDAQLNEMFAKAKNKNGFPLEYELAVEGMEIELP